MSYPYPHTCDLHSVIESIDPHLSAPHLQQPLSLNLSIEDPAIPSTSLTHVCSPAIPDLEPSTPGVQLDKRHPPAKPERRSVRSSPRKRVSFSLGDDDGQKCVAKEKIPPAGEERNEWKKMKQRQASKRSRDGRMLYILQLEANTRELTIEREKWRTRTLVLAQILRSHNVPCPDVDD